MRLPEGENTIEVRGYDSSGNKFSAKSVFTRKTNYSKVLRQLSLMEEWGSGYHRIVTACTEGEYPLPEWEEIGPVLRVTFVPHPQTTTLPLHQEKEDDPVNVPVNERQQWFLEQLRQGIQCGPADIAAKWDAAQKTAKRDIADLRKKAFIIFVGPPKTGSYKLK